MQSGVLCRKVRNLDHSSGVFNSFRNILFMVIRSNFFRFFGTGHDISCCSIEWYPQTGRISFLATNAFHERTVCVRSLSRHSLFTITNNEAG